MAILRKWRLRWWLGVQLMRCLSQRLCRVLQCCRLMLRSDGLLFGRAHAIRDSRRLLWQRVGRTHDAVLLSRSHRSGRLLTALALAPASTIAATTHAITVASVPAIAAPTVAVAVTSTSAIAAPTVAIAVASASAIAASTVAVAVTSAFAITVILGELRGLDVQPGGVGDSARQYLGLRWHELWSADPVGSSRRGRHCGLCRVQ